MNRDDDDDIGRRGGWDRHQGPAGGMGRFKGYGSYGNPPDHGEASQRQYGGLGADQVGRQQRPFDPDYEHWREQQMRDLDEEYGQWRQERQKKFSDEFEQWRQNRRSGQSGLTGSGAGASSAGGNNTGDSSTASGASGTKRTP